MTTVSFVIPNWFVFFFAFWSVVNCVLMVATGVLDRKLEKSNKKLIDVLFKIARLSVEKDDCKGGFK